MTPAVGRTGGSARWRTAERYVLGDMLERQAAERADKVCMYFDDVPLTFGDLDRRANSTANWLHQRGIAPGDTVATLLGSNATFTDVWFGAAKTGSVFVPINTAQRGDFLSHQLRDCGARVVVADADLAPRIVAVAGECPELETLLVRPLDDGSMPDLGATGGLHVETAQVLLDDGGDVLRAPRGATWDGPGCLLYTSGTTGPSKGVSVTQHYLASVTRTIIDVRQVDVDEVCYGSVPLFHFSGMLGLALTALMAGSTTVIDTRFSVSSSWDRVRRYQATSAIFIGSMLLMLWNLPPDPSDAELPIRVLAGAPIPPDLQRPLEERYRCKVITMYGMTEAFPLSYAGVKDDVPPGSAGRTNPIFDVRLFDDDGQEVDTGEIGEIVCRPLESHVMFEGYHGRPEATMGQLGDLWFHTGDLGRFDDGGNLYFVDRKKDALRRRGENISSFELEAAVARHAAVAEVAAHAVPSEFSEDDVKICVVLEPGVEVSYEELMDHCVAKVPFFAVPRYVEFLPELPKNAVGRILKYQLRERGVTDATWDREAAGYTVTR